MTQNSKARMIKNTAVTPIAIPALAPALRVGCDGGGGPVEEEGTDAEEEVGVMVCVVGEAELATVEEDVDGPSVVAGSV